MADILYAPNPEHVVTTNVWAFLRWLRSTRGIDLADWGALQRYSAGRSTEFRAAVAQFARLPERPVRLARHSGTREALVFRKADGSRLMFSRDELVRVSLEPSGLPAELAASLARLWPPAVLVRPCAELLLHTDLRPDDRLLVVGPAWPWLVALLEGCTVILATEAGSLLAVAAEECATVLVAPAQTLAEAAFRRPRNRPNLASLRSILATGGPLSPEGRRRIYTWVKSDLMLLARTGDTVWGNPLEPVPVRPVASPALLTPRASGPATP